MSKMCFFLGGEPASKKALMQGTESIDLNFVAYLHLSKFHSIVFTEL